jgi:hypothetical protein
MMSNFTNANEPDKSKWSKYSLDLATKKLEVTVPGNFNKGDVLGPIVNREVDLEDVDSFTTFGFLTPLKISWNYGGGFWKGISGTMEFSILVEAYKPSEPDEILENLCTLQSFITEDYTKAFNQVGLENPSYNIVSGFEIIETGSTSWLKYKVPKLGDIIQYSTLISGKHYVTLRFMFINNTNDKKNTWREKAQEISEVIFKKINLK